MTEQTHTAKRTWLWALVAAWLAIGFLLQISAFWRHPAKPADLVEIARNKAIALGYLAAGLTTLAFWLARKKWRPYPNLTEKRRFLWLGWIGAAWVETLFWAGEKIAGAQHVAASPNLFWDLVFTMPWYISMVWVFQKAQSKCGFAWPVAALLGGLYEMGCDGTLGAALSGALFSPGYLVLAFFIFPAFVVVYSPMVLPPVWLASTAPEHPAVGRARTKWALAPLLALIPFAFYFVAILVVAGAIAPHH